MSRVLVCGGRNYADIERVMSELDAARPTITWIIHGAARGADRLGEAWAKLRGVPRTPFPANWGAYGKRAGFLRNQEMIDIGKPDLVIAFPGGRGTADMVRRAKAAGIEVREIV